MHGCHLGQGDYFSPPVSSNDINAVVRSIEQRLEVDAPGIH